MRAITKLKNTILEKQVLTTHPYTQLIYGTKVQMANQVDNGPLLDKEDNIHAQKGFENFCFIPE